MKTFANHFFTKNLTDIANTQRHLLIAVLLGFLLSYPIVTAAFDIKAKYITTADGLSNNTVRFFCQDHKGFIWMATLNGLNRYDGHNIRTFMPNNNGNLTLADRRINTIKEDKNGFLWITTTSKHISCFDLETEKFVDFTGCGEQDKQYKNVELFTNSTWLWGDNGCLRVICKDGRFSSERFSKDNGKIRDKEVMRIVDSAVGTWILTSRSLYLYNNGKLRLIANDMDLMWACARGEKTFFASLNGTIWIYAKGSLKKIGRIPNVTSSYDIPGQAAVGDKWYIFASTGGYCIDMSKNVLNHATGGLDIKTARSVTDNKGNHWLYNGTGILRFVNGRTGSTKDFNLMADCDMNLIDQERYHVVQARNGITWISTYGGGLYAYDTKNDILHRYTATDNKGLIQSDELLHVYEDRSGNIWTGSWLGGASQISVTNSGGYTNLTQMGQVRLINVETPNVWIGNLSGDLFLADESLKNVKPVPNKGGNIYAMCRDNNGTMWLGSKKNGLLIGDKWYSKSTDGKQSIVHNAVYALLKDKKGRMWTGTLDGGLNLTVPDGKGGYKFKRFLTETYGMGRIRSLALDNNGWIWVGTSGGLVVFNPEQIIRNPKAYFSYNESNNKLHSNEVRCILKDSHGNMWIAETGEGFCVCKPGKNYSELQFEHYGVSDGLVNNMVQGFAEDRQGRIWVSTEYGISCFSPTSKSFRNMFFAPTMAGNTYNENSAATLKDGRLIFGTRTGVTIINPALITNKTEKRRIIFSDLAVNGIIMRPDSPDYPLPVALPYAKEIKLAHNQNSLMIYFSTLDFSTATQTLYSYKLEKYENYWSSPSSLNFATYKNLSPGTYYLHVRATDGDGTWNKDESVIKIIIAPPFWATPLAYIIYILLICGIAYLALRTFRKMNALRTQMKVEEQLADYKLVFFTNISHEFRTPLTLIQAAMEKLERAENNRQERTTALRLMSKSVDRLLRLINELLEFRKAEKGKLTLQLENADVVRMLKGFYESFKETASNKNMTYLFESNTDTCDMLIDSGKLDKIIYNLLSNAFKYTPAGGTITMTADVDYENNQFTIKVTDTGIGIPKARRDKMFTRFATGNTSRNSIGIGLHLVHELVVVHKGTIRYDENPNGGSIFTVRLPLSKDVYQPSDYLSQDSTLLDDTDKTIPSDNASNVIIKNDIDDGTPIGIKPMNDRIILVIEDDDDVRSLLAAELSAYATVVTRPDGTSGYDYAKDNDVDLILCDVMMPGMDGFEVTRRLKENFDTSHIPVIILTALNAEESRLKGAQCGADSYITKPFSSQLLLTRIFKLIEQREKLKEKFSNDVTAVRPLISTTDNDKKFVDKLTEVITSNLTNPDFSVDDFASAMSLGRTILYRKVRGVTGYAPKEYLRIMRMKKAAELLLKSEVNVSEVAYAVGLSDPFYFSKCFKQQFGMSPSAYKKNGGIASGTDSTEPDA